MICWNIKILINWKIATKTESRHEVVAFILKERNFSFSEEFESARRISVVEFRRSFTFCCCFYFVPFLFFHQWHLKERRRRWVQNNRTPPFVIAEDGRGFCRGGLVLFHSDPVRWRQNRSRIWSSALRMWRMKDGMFPECYRECLCFWGFYCPNPSCKTNYFETIMGWPRFAILGQSVKFGNFHFCI